MPAKAHFQVTEKAKDTNGPCHLEALFHRQIRFSWWIRLLFYLRKIPLPHEMKTVSYVSGERLVKIWKGRLWKWIPDGEDVELIWEFVSTQEHLKLNTRIYCHNSFAYRKFKNYWYRVYSLSRLFRKLMLRSIIQHPCKPS